MKALVKYKSERGLKLEELNKPEIADNEAMVQVKAAGICGTDIPIIEGRREVPDGLIPGHEFAGVVTEVGSAVKNFAVGDRVTASLVISCNQCTYCQTNAASLCPELVEIGIDRNGAFAEYVAVPEQNLHQLPKNVGFETAAMTDPLSAAYRAIQKAKIRSTDRVVILGSGPIGLFALQLSLLEGAKQVITVGRSRQYRLDVAHKLGSSGEVNLSQDSLYESVEYFTKGEMANVVIEASGDPEAIREALKILSKKGRVILVGIFHDQACLNPLRIVKNEIEIIGSFCYTNKEFEECLGLFSPKRINTEEIITHRFSISNYKEALKATSKANVIKIVIKP